MNRSAFLLIVAVVSCETVAAQSHSERAAAAEQAGNYEMAIRELRDAVLELPADGQLRTALGVAFFHEGYLADAIGEFRTAIQIQPDDLDARSNLAVIWMNLGDVESALPEIERMVASDPNDLASRSSLGLCYLQTGRWDSAAREYTALLKADPSNPELLYNLAVAQKHRQDDEGARDLLRKSLEIKPDFPAAEFELGETYWQAGMLDEAIGQLQLLVRTHTDFSPAYFPLAEAQRQKGDLDGALATVQAVLRLGPNPSAYQQLAILEKQKGDVDGAAKAFHEAEQLRNKFKLQQAAQLATAAAKRLMQAHDLPGAVRKLEFALSVDAGLAETHFQLGLALKEQHNESRARQEFQKAFELDARLKPPHEP